MSTHGEHLHKGAGRTEGWRPGAAAALLALSILGPGGCKSRAVSEGPVCGNGVVEMGEICDDGNTADNDLCRRDCGQDLSVCGNGELDPGEGRDLATANSDQPSAPCRTDCQPQRCGDGIRDAEEACDGTDFSGDRCADWGLQGEQPGCTGGCAVDLTACDGCGSGVCEPSETYDTCTSDCGVMDIATEAYGSHSCAVLGDGSAWCWGSGYLGNGEHGTSQEPVQVVF
ncbi:hypothetical protein ACFL51_01365 [Myxococcota bacterium]